MRRLDVRMVRKQLGLTQAELARLIDAKERSVRRWEKGEVKPLKYYESQIRRLVKRHAAGEPLTGPRSTLAVPRALRVKLPAPNDGTGDLRSIGIVPSSF